MTDDDLKIFVDAARPATLNDGAGKQTDFASLEEAVRAWRLLPSMVKIRATVKLIGGPVFRAQQIERLHYRPTSDRAASIRRAPGRSLRPFRNRTGQRERDRTRRDLCRVRRQAHR